VKRVLDAERVAQILVREFTQESTVDGSVGKSVFVLAESEGVEPVRNVGHSPQTNLVGTNEGGGWGEHEQIACKKTRENAPLVALGQEESPGGGRL
jgi:hypothetical protein